jgi:cytochrome c biogenesis protein
VLVPDETLYRTFSNMEELVIPASVDEVRKKVVDFTSSHFSTPVVTEENGKVHLFAQKAAYARFGVYVTHSSILIIFIGAIIGTLWGYKAFVNITEGTATDKVWPRGSNEPIDLGFSVRCDEFTVSYYEGSRRPREFRSLLTVTDGGKIITEKRSVIVNDPLTYKGITFYQSSYGPAGDPVFDFKVRVKATGEVVNITARQGQRVQLPGGGAFRVVDFTPSYQNFGPGARLEVFPEGGKPSSFIVLQAFPDFDAQRGGVYSFSMVDFKQRFYTGLQVAKDPGVWVVWVGCTLMVLGSMIAFFLSHRRIWITILPVGGKTGIKLGGSAHRNQPAFELFFDDFKKNLKTELAVKEKGGK